MIIHAQMVILREKRLSDSYNDYAWRTDEELAKLDAAKPLRVSFEEYLRFYQEELEYPTLWSRRFAIDTLNGQHIGNCMYYDIDTVKGQAELGILIGDRRFWGKGYGEDTVAALLKHIFTTTSLKRIYLHTLDWNTRALRCFEKSGFTRLRVVKRDGYNFVLMEAIRDTWLALHDSEQSANDNQDAISLPAQAAKKALD